MDDFTGRVFNSVRRWLAEERQKIAPLSWRQRIEYAWDYYKLWIIGILSFLLLMIYITPRLFTANRENWLYACFANTYADIGSGSDFWEQYARYADYDLDEKNLIFNAQVYCDPPSEDYGNQYYRLLIASMDSGVMDILIMEPERLQYLGASGRLMDLEDERARDIFQEYQDRLIWCEPRDQDYEKTRVAVGVDLTGSVLTGDGGAYPEGAALGINALSPHPDQAIIFLRYLFDTGTAGR